MNFKIYVQKIVLLITLLLAACLVSCSKPGGEGGTEHSSSDWEPSDEFIKKFLEERVKSVAKERGIDLVLVNDTVQIIDNVITAFAPIKNIQNSAVQQNIKTIDNNLNTLKDQASKFQSIADPDLSCTDLKCKFTQQDYNLIIKYFQDTVTELSHPIFDQTMNKTIPDLESLLTNSEVTSRLSTTQKTDIVNSLTKLKSLVKIIQPFIDLNKEVIQKFEEMKNDRGKL